MPKSEPINLRHVEGESLIRYSSTTRSDPLVVQFKNEQFASMAAAKRQSEHSRLLEASPSTEASNERVSLSQLATQRLGSLKWLISRDLTVSPLGKQSAGGTPGSKADGDSGDRGTTWRSYTVDMSDVPSSVSETGTDGTVSKAPERRHSHHHHQRTKAPGQTGSTAKRRHGKRAPYRLSIDLERAPEGSSVWVKRRRSSPLVATSGSPTEPQDGDSRAEDGNNWKQSTEFRDLMEEEDDIGSEDDTDTAESREDVDRVNKLERLWATGGATIGIIWAVTLVCVVGGELGIVLGSALGLVVAVLLVYFISRGEPICCWGELAEEDDWLSQLEEEGHHFRSAEGNDAMSPTRVTVLTI